MRRRRSELRRGCPLRYGCRTLFDGDTDRCATAGARATWRWALPRLTLRDVASNRWQRAKSANEGNMTEPGAKKRTLGIVACATRSRGGDAVGKRAKTCSAMCPKPEGSCNGCRNSFGWVSAETALLVEQWLTSWRQLELARRSPPYQKGQSVQLDGKDCRFQRYRSRKGKHNWCWVIEEGSGVNHSRVAEHKLETKARNCPMPPQSMLSQLHFGEVEFRKLSSKYAKWSGA